MNSETENYQQKSLHELLTDWQEGKLSEDAKQYVISKVPIMGYLMNEDHSSEFDTDQIKNNR